VIRYRVLACDYDGTLASGGRLSVETQAALGRLKASGRSVVMVTGRQIDGPFARRRDRRGRASSRGGRRRDEACDQGRDRGAVHRLRIATCSAWTIVR
jgi:hypothetical protein